MGGDEGVVRGMGLNVGGRRLRHELAGLGWDRPEPSRRSQLAARLVQPSAPDRSFAAIARALSEQPPDPAIDQLLGRPPEQHVV